MALGRDYRGQDCSLARALELLGERWTMLVLRDAFYGVCRYTDFRSHIGAPRAVLAERLDRLVAAGVLERRRYQDAPARYEYVLTDAGLDLWPAIYTLGRWGDRYRCDGRGPSKIFRHAACGTTLDERAGCPNCGGYVPPGEVEIHPGPGANPTIDDPVSQALRRPRRLLQPLVLSEA